MPISKKTKVATLGALMTSVAGSLSGAVINVSEDGFINAYAGNPDQRPIVRDGGTGEVLAVRTPDGPGASQYNNVAFLGFDTSGVDLSAQTSASVSFTVARTSFGSGTIRLYLLDDNLGGDSFDETALSFQQAVNDYGIVRTNAIANSQVTGAEIVEDVTDSFSVGQEVTFNLTGAALTSLQNSGGNDFVTFVVESRTPYNNPTFGVASKENTTYDGATLTVVPEPSTALLFGLGAPLLLLRRRK